ncbi:MAG TPA: UDP-N-acetylglucosamine 2-epimerase (non-hydrolyzing), partial [Bacteroidia bacterium]|nr:UDP-N-acetylglucosamine 2-epimerase (non-hydrolyzing) [Bacteroidia bacterium]
NNQGRDRTADYFLDVPPGSPNGQIAEIMVRLEKVFLEFQPDLVLVVGDVNSTLAASITANKMGIRLGHIESGLRSNDRTMPEEFNRLVTDELADFLFVTEQSGLDHLAEEKKKTAIHFVGNTMIDTMVAFDKQIDAAPVLDTLKLQPGKYVLMTMHRPSNVDTREGLELLLQLVTRLTEKYDIVFPVHPRTVKFMQQYGLEKSFRDNSRIIFTEPLDYFAFQKLILHARFILTDSGGIQEETTFRQVPCLTLRPNTERPVTVTLGSNVLLPFEMNGIMECVNQIENGTFRKGEIPPLWDGRATERIFEVISTIH